MPRLPKCGWFGHCHGCDVPTMREGHLHKGRKTKTYYVCIRCRPVMLADIREVFEILHYTEDINCINIVVKRIK